MVEASPAVLAYGPYHMPPEQDWQDYEPPPEADEGEISRTLVRDKGLEIGLRREEWGHAIEDHEASEEPGYEEDSAPESRLSLTHSSPSSLSTSPSPVKPFTSRIMAKGAIRRANHLMPVNPLEIGRAP